MSKKLALSVLELQSILAAILRAQDVQRAKVGARLIEVLGNETAEGGPEIAAVKDRVFDFVAGVVARRLKRNRRTVPFFSSRDFVRLVGEIDTADDEEATAEARAMLKRLGKAFCTQLSEMLFDMVPRGKSPYDELWRLMRTVRDLSAERGVPPEELLALEESGDEIARRMYSKKQFAARHRRAMKKLLDIGTTKKLVIEPLLAMVGDKNEEERREVEKALEEEIIPQIRVAVEKVKGVADEMLAEDLERIYGE